MKKCKRKCFVNHLHHHEVRYHCVAVIILPSKYQDVEDQSKASVKARLFAFNRAVSMQDPSSLRRDWTIGPARSAQGPHHWTAREFPVALLPSSPFFLSGESVEDGNLKLALDLGVLCDPAELIKAW